MGQTRVLVLAVFLRISIFNILLLLTCIFDGMPNVNSTVLMLSLILVIPLPRLEPVIFILDEIYTIISVYFRVVHKLFSWMYSLVLSPCLACLSPVVRWWLRRFSVAGIFLRSMLPYCKAMVVWLVPCFVSNILLSVGETVVIVPILWARGIYWFVNGPLRWMHAGFLHIQSMYSSLPENFSLLPRYSTLLLLTVTALVIALPSPVSVLNYIVTGYGYPGSTIRFHHCPGVRKTNMLSYIFLEISYSLWNIARTVHFYLFSKYLFPGSWCVNINIKGQIGPGYNTWLMSYARMFSVGLVTPFVLPFQCYEQVINNILCTLCHVAFLTILNGHTRMNFFVVYYGACSILVHIESTLVAVTGTLHSLRLTVNDYVTTVICMMELYLMLHVSWLTCKIIWRKIKTPREDVLWK